MEDSYYILNVEYWHNTCFCAYSSLQLGNLLLTEPRFTVYNPGVQRQARREE